MSDFAAFVIIVVLGCFIIYKSISWIRGKLRRQP